MKKTEKIINRDIDEFENHVNLYRMVSGGESKALVLLRKIADKIHRDNYENPGTKLPSILIYGKQSTRLHCIALLNSLCIEDIRECNARYLDSGISSKEIFEDSLYSTAHMITDIDQLRPAQETTIWRFLRLGRCIYYNYPDRTQMYIHCNGIILLTSKNLKSSPIVSAIDYKVEIEDFTQQQLELIVHQRLNSCSIDYGADEQVLKSIVKYGKSDLGRIVDILKTCILLAQEELTLKTVEKAVKLMPE